MSENGRAASFTQGAYEVKYPSFDSRQVGAGKAGFQAKSVFDQAQVLKGANGMSLADRARQPIQGRGMSINGQSAETFDKRLWIDSPYRTFG